MKTFSNYNPRLSELVQYAVRGRYDMESRDDESWTTEERTSIHVMEHGSHPRQFDDRGVLATLYSRKFHSWCESAACTMRWGLLRRVIYEEIMRGFSYITSNRFIYISPGTSINRCKIDWTSIKKVDKTIAAITLETLILGCWFNIFPRTNRKYCKDNSWMNNYEDNYNSMNILFSVG